MKQNHSFTNSGLGRANPRRHVFHSWMNKSLKRHKSETGLVEDRTSSVAIVRIIIGLLLLHLVIIGGVLLKGHFDKMASGVAVSPTLTPPPDVAAPERQPEEVLPQPTQQVAVATPAPAQQASAGNHITQPAAEVPLFPDEDTAEVVATPVPTPVVVTPPVVAPAPVQQATAPAEPSAPTTTIKYLVNSGDTWYGIATQHKITVDALKAANPTAARKNNLYQGSYINIPVRADSAEAQAAAAAAPPAPVAKTYTIKRGDTLAKIARKHKMTVPALMKLNDLSDRDARRIQPGQKLKVAE